MTANSNKSSGKPKISVIIASYNRAGSIERSIRSLLNQTFSDFEIIIVDDGSTDNTQEVLKSYKNKVRIFRHKVNRGVCAAKNTGLDQIRGEWFTFLDDDDELLPNAFEEMLNVPKLIDPTIDAVTCNCIDFSTKEFSGRGLSKSGYLKLQEIVAKCSGEFWGMTKTKLLGNLRFNDSMPGGENTLWYRVDDVANRYYIHKGLRIYHTGGTDRVTIKQRAYKSRIQFYKGLAHDDFYWNVLYRFNLPKFKKECLKGRFYLSLDSLREPNPYDDRINHSELKLTLPDFILYSLPKLFGPKILRSFYSFFLKARTTIKA